MMKRLAFHFLARVNWNNIEIKLLTDSPDSVRERPEATLEKSSFSPLTKVRGGPTVASLPVRLVDWDIIKCHKCDEECHIFCAKSNTLDINYKDVTHRSILSKKKNKLMTCSMFMSSWPNLNSSVASGYEK